MHLGSKFRSLGLAMAVVFTLAVLMSGCGGQKAAPESKYPEKNVSGIIQWGAGGATDNVARAITPLAQKDLGATIVLQNMTGATGAVATQYVFDQKPNGYTLLYGAENPNVYGVLQISDRNYSEFEPISVLGRGVAVVVAPANSKWSTLQELVEDAKKNPKKINMGSTGPGGLPFVVAAMMKSAQGLEFNLVPFDGEGPAMTAMLGGHVDFVVSGLTAAANQVKAGKAKALAVVATDPVDILPDVPPITKIYPEYGKFLPWGPFYGVFAKKGIPEPAKQKLVAAFKKAFDDPEFQKVLKNLGAVPMGISGEEANKFIDHNRSVSSWLLWETGAAKKNPEELGIKKTVK